MAKSGRRGGMKVGKNSRGGKVDKAGSAPHAGKLMAGLIAIALLFSIVAVYALKSEPHAREIAQAVDTAPETELVEWKLALDALETAQAVDTAPEAETAQSGAARAAQAARRYQQDFRASKEREAVLKKYAKPLPSYADFQWNISDHEDELFEFQSMVFQTPPPGSSRIVVEICCDYNSPQLIELSDYKGGPIRKGEQLHVYAEATGLYATYSMSGGGADVYAPMMTIVEIVR